MKELLERINQPLKLQLKLRPLPIGGGVKAGTGVVAKDWEPPLDLLRERREALELEPLSGVLGQRPALLRRGLMVGGLVLGASLGVCGLLLGWQQVLKARLAELEGYEGEVAQLTKTVQASQALLKKTQAGNGELVERLTEVRSSSALLADLQLRVPEGVQITSVQTKQGTAGAGPGSMAVQGVARDPVAFGRVNALELVLRQSPLIAASGEKLAKAERVPARMVEVKPAEGKAQGKEPQKLELPSAVVFELNAQLSPLPANRLVKVLEGLKAEGMVRRLQVLEREGLLQ
ncbi:MAG: PilN domain-containing protein [Cyanobium sp.]